MGERVKLGLLCLLFVLALGVGILMAGNAIQAGHRLQQQNSALRAKDVSAIRPWMTIHVVAHVYAIPETYLEQALKMTRTDPLRKMTLYEIASSRHQPVEQVIHTLQQAILTYRQRCPCSSAPAQSLKLRRRSVVPVPEELFV